MSMIAPEAPAEPAAAPAAEEPNGAVYFDGTSNRKRRVTLRLEAELEILEEGRLVATWPYDALRRADGPPRRLRLACTSAPSLARIEIADGVLAQALTARSPALDMGRGGASQAWRIVFWSMAAACSIVGIVVFAIPLMADRLAPIVPAGIEARIGDAVDKQVRLFFEAKPCTGAEGQAAFDVLMTKLKQAGGIETALQASVMSSTVPNAVALPGGKIYVFDGLLQRARNADELAGVIAHELGHVRNRDNMRKIIQNGGTSFLIGLLFGDVLGGSAVIFASRTLLDASHSREAERQADAFTIELMHKLGRSPTHMGELLFRITGAQGKKSLTLLASHPLTEERRDVMRKAERANTGPELLSASEWAALKTICKAP